MLSRGGDVLANQLQDTTAAVDPQPTRQALLTFPNCQPRQRTCDGLFASLAHTCTERYSFNCRPPPPLSPPALLIRSGASFLPSAFIIGLQPGSTLDVEVGLLRSVGSAPWLPGCTAVEGPATAHAGAPGAPWLRWLGRTLFPAAAASLQVVVVAEDGVTTDRYPLQLVLVESQEWLTPAGASSHDGVNSSSAAEAEEGRSRGERKPWCAALLVPAPSNMLDSLVWRLQCAPQRARLFDCRPAR